MPVKTIEEIDISSKRVLMRTDFNVPLDENLRITSDKRIEAALPSIRYLLDNGARVILMSHLGRPNGKRVPEMSLKPVTERLSHFLGQPVKMAPDCIGEEVERMVEELGNGEVILLENLRFHSEETDNAPEFSRKLSALADVYVNDAFGTAHRTHASTEGITHFVRERACGYLMKKELDYFKGVIDDPKRPFIAILGGAKISGKIDVIKNLLEKADTVLVGGGMAYTFFKSMGLEIGKSLLEKDKISVAAEVLSRAKKSSAKLILPEDCVVADRFAEDADTQVVPRNHIPPGWEALDIGPKTCMKFTDVILKAKTIVMNGPMGVFEMDRFIEGTKAVVDAIARATDDGAISIIGGGDSAAAVSKCGMTEKMSHISTGGGAFLELLEGKELPGIKALEV